MSDKPQHVQRMEDELRELQRRVSALKTFLSTFRFLELPSSEQRLLRAQYGTMVAYEIILTLRVETANA